MGAVIIAISSNVARFLEAARRLSTVALNRHLEYCELLAEAQRRSY
ncbi:MULTISPECIES: hypothetical protein [Paraburkholderia]|jgi:hypothetical protein|nr:MULTISPECIES: hypothetical protein [Paraburkholderia]